MSGRSITDADAEAIARIVVDRLDARLRKARPSAKRRTREPELAARLAADVTPADDVARERAKRAIAKLRRIG
jgi:hypothetical protein